MVNLLRLLYTTLYIGLQDRCHLCCPETTQPPRRGFQKTGGGPHHRPKLTPFFLATPYLFSRISRRTRVIRLNTWDLALHPQLAAHGHHQIIYILFGWRTSSCPRWIAEITVASPPQLLLLRNGEKMKWHSMAFVMDEVVKQRC